MLLPFAAATAAAEKVAFEILTVCKYLCPVRRSNTGNDPRRRITRALFPPLLPTAIGCPFVGATPPRSATLSRIAELSVIGLAGAVPHCGVGPCDIGTTLAVAEAVDTVVTTAAVLRSRAGGAIGLIVSGSAAGGGGTDSRFRDRLLAPPASGETSGYDALPASSSGSANKCAGGGGGGMGVSVGEPRGAAKADAVDATELESSEKDGTGVYEPVEGGGGGGESGGDNPPPLVTDVRGGGGGMIPGESGGGGGGIMDARGLAKPAGVTIAGTGAVDTGAGTNL